MMALGSGEWRDGGRLAERTMCGLGGQGDSQLDSESVYLIRYLCYLLVNPMLSARNRQVQEMPPSTFQPMGRAAALRISISARMSPGRCVCSYARTWPDIT